MRSRTAALAAAAMALTGCGQLPWESYGDPPPECDGLFVPDVDLVWAGVGAFEALGLAVTPEARNDVARAGGPGEIFVGADAAHPDGMSFCYLTANRTELVVGPVPAGWEPP